MKIFSGRTSIKLADKICRILNSRSLQISGEETFSRGRLKIDQFSDDEMLPLFEESIRSEDIIFIQSTNSSDAIIETLLVIDAAKRADCKSFTLVAPIQGYSRQDKTDHLRSSIGSKMLADILEKVGVSKVITIDLHASSIQGFYNVPIIHVNGNKIFIDHIRNIEDVTILAPDQGAVKRASDFCKALPDSTFAMINKKRIKPNEIHSMELVGDVEGRNVIIVDDMADTLGTLKKASEIVMSKGAKSVRAIATHGILSGKAMENLYDSPLTELLVSDSVPSVLEKESEQVGDKLKVVSCDNILAKTIWNLTNKKSIHEINMV